MRTRQMRKRLVLDSDEEEQPKKFHRGGNFYCSWD